MVLGWFGGRGGPGTPATVAPVPGPVWTGSTVAPVSISGSSGQFQRLDPRQIDPVNDRESVLAPPRAGLDQDAFLQEVTDRPLDRGLAQLRMPLDRPLRTPDARAIIRRLVRQKHDDLLARRTAELPLGTSIRNPPAHWMAPKAARTCEFCTGFVRDFGRFRRIRRKSKRAFLHASAEPLANKPYFSGNFGDPGRIRTCNLPLRS